MIKGMHHVALISGDYERSKKFYTQVLGFEIINEAYREDRKSYKLDLALNGDYLLEIFSFPHPADRPSYPEAKGLRHLAFKTDNIEYAFEALKNNKIKIEQLRIDEFTGKRFFFFYDPDGQPLEMYEL